MLGEGGCGSAGERHAGWNDEWGARSCGWEGCQACPCSGGGGGGLLCRVWSECRAQRLGGASIADSQQSLLNLLPLLPLSLLLQGEQFGYCPPWALAWPYRRLNLLKELLGYDADILCLQEVQSNHFQVGVECAVRGCGCEGCGGVQRYAAAVRGAVRPTAATAASHHRQPPKARPRPRIPFVSCPPSSLACPSPHPPDPKPKP